MALTLRDVVENRISQRASGVRSDRVTARDANDGPRERFSLAETNERAAQAAQMRASANARSDATRTNADRNTSWRADDVKPARAEDDAARATSARSEPARSNSPSREATAAAKSEPDMPSSDASRSNAAEPDAAEQPATGSVEGGTDPVSLEPAKATDQRVPPPAAPGRRPGIGRPAAPAKQGGTLNQAPAGADAALAGQAEVQGAETASAEATASASEGEGDEAAGSKTEAGTGAAALPMLAVFAAPPPSAPSPAASLAAKQATDGEGESEIEGTASAANAAGGVAPGNGPARGAAATRPGFEAALAEAIPESAGDGAAASAAALNAGAAVSDKPVTGPPGSSEATATAATQPQAQTSPATAPVPLGAVPMTIGLRALGASNRFEIRLDPKELGRIDVSIDIDKDNGTVGARLVVDRPETLALLQRDASSLQQALAQTGLDPSAGVTLSLRGGEGESPRDGRESSAGAQSRNDGQTDRSGAQAGTEQAAIDRVPLRALRGFGRVDIRI